MQELGTQFKCDGEAGSGSSRLSTANSTSDNNTRVLKGQEPSPSLLPEEHLRGYSLRCLLVY